MLKRSVYETYLKDNLKTCCQQRVWYNWKLLNKKNENKEEKLDVLVPDISRVFRKPYDISSKDYSYLNNLLNRRRQTNL
jgi:hypothetical protein